VSPQSMTLKLRYFAILSEQAGCSEESLEAADLPGLYAEAARRHGFTLAQAQVRPAVNDEFVSWDHALRAGDEVAFIPPVSGG